MGIDTKFKTSNSGKILMGFAGNGYVIESNEPYQLEVPAGVKYITDRAFSDRNISEVILPEGIESLGIETFSYCSNLEKVNIPKSLQDIGPGCFNSSGNENFSFVLDPENPYFYLKDGALISKDGEVLIHMDTDGISELAIPDGVVSIGLGAFNGNADIHIVRLPRSVISIELEAFVGCEYLTDIFIPETVRSIGEWPQYVDFDQPFAYADNVVIHAPKGSYAIEYAKRENIKYREE